MTPPAQRDELIDELFPNRPLPPKLAREIGAPKTLKEIEGLALANNPEMVQATADITTAMGGAIQAGVYPNPVIGYEADTVGSAGTRNYQGVFATQTIKTAGKLGLARAAANMDLMNAQLELRKTRFDLLARVRSAYYAVLVAQQNVAIMSAMAWLTNEAYRIQVDKLRSGEATASRAGPIAFFGGAGASGGNSGPESVRRFLEAIDGADWPTRHADRRARRPSPICRLP